MFDDTMTTIYDSVRFLGDGAHAVAIWKEANKRLNRDVALGQLYTCLQRLETEGLLETRKATDANGKERVFWNVTKTGTMVRSQTVQGTGLPAGGLKPATRQAV